MAEEEGMVYTRIIELVYEVVPLLVPFEPTHSARLKRHMRSNTNDGSTTTYSAADEEDEDEGFNETNGTGAIIQRFVERIQDRLVIDCRIRYIFVSSKNFNFNPAPLRKVVLGLR